MFPTVIELSKFKSDVTVTILRYVVLWQNTNIGHFSLQRASFVPLGFE